MKILLTLFAIAIVALPVVIWPAIALDVVTVPAALAIITFTWSK